MTRWTLVGVLLLAQFAAAGCGSSRCAPGEVPNDVLQACVIPKKCDAGMMLNDRNECAATQGVEGEQGDVAPSAGSGEPREPAADSNAGQAGETAGAPGSIAGVAGDEPVRAPSGGMGGSAGAVESGAAGNGGSPAPTAPVCGNNDKEAGELCDGDCPASCEIANACLSVILMGSRATCDAKCVTTEITECVSGDGCCAKGCKYPDDTDCSKSCGDGVVSAPETCEPTSKDKPCPESCDDGDPCTEDMRTGTPEQCNVACTHLPITAAKSGDACCPKGANAKTDDDCKPVCGNKVVEPGESCDGNCPSSCDDGDPCTVDKLAGDPARCSAVCMPGSAITTPRGGDGCCPAGANANNDSDCSDTCGNGVRERNEICDGDCPTDCNDGDPCTADKLTGSKSSCNARCQNSPMMRTGPASCDDGNPCTKDERVESRDTCTYQCTHGPEMARPAKDCNDNNPCTDDKAVPSSSSCTFDCTHGPEGARPAKDCNDNNPCTDDKAVPSSSSCTFDCSHGPAKDRGPQPDCNDGNPCTEDHAVPAQDSCTYSCSHGSPTTVAKSGDGCCPAGANANNDSDCSARCGNGVVEPGETCDPQTSCPRKDDCHAVGCDEAVFTGDPSTCDSRCEMRRNSANQCGGCSSLQHPLYEKCRVVMDVCSADGEWICDGTNAVKCFSAGNGAGEICDGQDNDCDSIVDEQCSVF